MTATNVLVLGTSGMLGSVVYDWLRRDPTLKVSGSARSTEDLSSGVVQRVDAERGEVPWLGGVDWVINCIGVTKPHIHDDNRDEVSRAIVVNAEFPSRLARAAERSGTRVIQIATDCVYSGRDGCYDEGAQHDATDVYGKSKSLGEVSSPSVLHLRCSIVGPERKGFVSLLAWLQKQEHGATVDGYRNHQWNGLTTLHFAKICRGIIGSPPDSFAKRHVVPDGDITKADLLRTFAREYERHDLTINDVDAPTVIDRRLRTTDPERNAALWRAAGYDHPPTVETMVRELAEYSRDTEAHGASAPAHRPSTSRVLLTSPG